MIALDLPLYGEEVLQIHLKENKVSGNFLKRIKPTTAFTQFMQAWREWVKAVVEKRLPKGADVELLENQLKLTTALTKGKSVTLTLHELNKENFFARQTLALNDESAKEDMKLELFTFECRNPAMH